MQQTNRELTKEVEQLRERVNRLLLEENKVIRMLRSENKLLRTMIVDANDEAIKLHVSALKCGSKEKQYKEKVSELTNKLNQMNGEQDES